MSLMDLFKPSAPKSETSAPAQQQQQQQQPNQFNQGNAQQNAATKTTEGTAANGAVPAEGSTAGIQESPLDKFKDIWKNEPNNDSNTPQGLFNVDMNKLMESSKKMDFTKQLNPEILKKVAAGGEESIAAFSQALNELAQGLYAQSAFASTKISEEAVKLAEQKLTQQLPSFFKKQQARESLASKNAVFNHSSAQPIIEALQAQLAVKFPNASSAELTELTQEYLGGFAEAITGKKQGEADSSNSSKVKSNDIDWVELMLGNE